ncbi:phosphate transport system permease protein [Actinomadura sp. NBRC 104412]|uniref:phosphate ABC transporter permease subunit PstC n=1 Tax=Actinomadura sp. NBRC 104412 TaxID=3032203 RepID=UPI0024A236E5|nr:phosphate ABC transporter permease subunit PstC [Actinomadura sp. NBRC 104412]GLZ05258.1 phosphate transport system permease protein [Actinomadura sp. NBRC 104412]
MPTLADEAPAAGPPAPPPRPRPVVDRPTRPDRLFSRVTTAAAGAMFALLFLIGFFLLLRAAPALETAGWGFFTTVNWQLNADPPVFGVLGMLSGTVIVGTIACVFALPVSVLAALFITEYASPRLRTTLTGVVDLLAAIPSLLYGLWGMTFLNERIVPLSRWIGDNLGWIPIFDTAPEAELTGSMFIAGLVVSLMVMPITTSIMREVFAQTPPGEKEAALALGGTRWGMIRSVVLPFGRGGVIGGSMLGLGRALGETIAVKLLLPQVPILSADIMQDGGSTIAGFIAANAGTPDLAEELLACGLVLFVFTIVINLAAAAIIARSRSGADVEAP